MEPYLHQLVQPFGTVIFAPGWCLRQLVHHAHISWYIHTYPVIPGTPIHQQQLVESHLRWLT